MNYDEPNLPDTEEKPTDRRKNRNDLTNWEIGSLSPYELTEGGVIPLDMASQYQALEGKAEIEIVQELRGLLSSADGVTFNLNNIAGSEKLA